jgi:murein DD-endopeptidase MepM/ murein hydrolase activator NlpD
VLALLGLPSSCDTKPVATDVCTGYGESHASDYVLPFPVGKMYRVSQGNCSRPGDGHRGSERYAYDFEMPIGTQVVAMRAGVALHVEASHRDGEVASKGFDNYVVIRHDDGTHAVYAHLTHGGIDCELGSRVAQGQVIGRSGNTGNTNNFAHLHVAMHICDPVTNGSVDCPTWPLSFRNTEPHPNGLKRDQTYTALSF